MEYEIAVELIVRHFTKTTIRAKSREEAMAIAFEEASFSNIDAAEILDRRVMHTREKDSSELKHAYMEPEF